jgi:hypothetical protein
MIGVTENYSKFEVRAVVRFLQSEGLSQSEIHRRTVSVYGQNIFKRKEVSVWCKIFTDGRKEPNEGPKEDRGRKLYQGLRREEGRVKVRETLGKKQLCNTSHPSERNKTVKECFNF